MNCLTSGRAFPPRVIGPCAFHGHKRRFELNSSHSRLQVATRLEEFASFVFGNTRLDPVVMDKKTPTSWHSIWAVPNGPRT